MPTERSCAMHANDWVEVRSKQEILATLDKNGRLDGMPFMPQMFEYCGKRFRVHKSAHKACDPVYTMAARGVDNAVHLNLRCNGQAYGGCQAGCRLFWKDAWLKPVSANAARGSAPRDEAGCTKTPASYRGCTEEDVWRGTRRDGRLGEPDANTQFVCQNTELPQFSKPLSWWNPSQYVKDYASGNVTLGEMMRSAVYVLFGRRFGTRIPLLRHAYNEFQKLTGGMPTPVANGRIPAGQPQPGRKPQSPAWRSRARQVSRGDPGTRSIRATPIGGCASMPRWCRIAAASTGSSRGWRGFSTRRPGA